jgi:lipopolysaccharide biosynthesis regulator YciM
MNEWLWLVFALLLVAAASGWWLGWRQGSLRSGRGKGLSGSYFQGLNYLLNEESDKAIEIFLQLAEINQETIEIHLALGKLFRRRGEMDKAIRYHKHIISRPGLTAEQRTQALVELGEDYMQAGLLDRAERLFTELAEHERDEPGSAPQLLAIYQQEKDWSKAIEQARRLGSVDREHSAHLMSHFHCELAERAIEQGDLERAQQALRQARHHKPQSVRARLIEARLAQSVGAWQEALILYQSACELDPEALMLSAAAMEEGYRALGRLEDWQGWLEQFATTTTVLTPVLLLARLQAEQDPRVAVQSLLARLEERPTVRGLEQLMSIVGSHHTNLDLVSPQLIGEVMQRLLREQPRYRCRQCGFSSSTHHWQCPSCRSWSSTRLISGVWGE